MTDIKARNNKLENAVINWQEQKKAPQMSLSFAQENGQKI